MVCTYTTCHRSMSTCKSGTTGLVSILLVSSRCPSMGPLLQSRTGQVHAILWRGPAVSDGNTGLGAVRWSYLQLRSRGIHSLCASVTRTVISVHWLCCLQKYAGVRRRLFLCCQTSWHCPKKSAIYIMWRTICIGCTGFTSCLTFVSAIRLLGLA